MKLVSSSALSALGGLPNTETSFVTINRLTIFRVFRVFVVETTLLIGVES
ncbi:MAG: hypothetical protein ACETVX_04390 [bacterium]